MPDEGAVAPVVVLVHGSMDRGAAFARTTGRLRDLHTIRYDRRGYGRSVGLGAPDIDGHVDDLLAIVDGRPSVLVGHSIGGLITLAAAARAPENVRAVAVYEAPTPWAPWWPRQSAGSVAMAADPADAAEKFVRRMVGDERWEAMGDGVRADRRAEGAALQAELRSARTGAPFDPAELDVPVIVAHGTASREHHIGGAVGLAEALGVEPVVFEGADHGAHLTHSEEFADLVRRAVAMAQ